MLDEPTNHLDMRSKDILKNALLQYGGTVIVVSHDRDFLQGLTQKVFEFKHRQIKEFIGDIYDFIETRNIESLTQLEQKTKSPPESAAAQTAENKKSWEQKKQTERELRKLQKRVSSAEEAIVKLEKEIASLEAIIADPSRHPGQLQDGELFASYEKAKKQLQQQELLWEAASHELEDFEKRQ